MSSPVPGLTILAAYLYFILSWGPRYMANRKPYKLENVLIAYNLIQVIVSTYIFYEVGFSLTRDRIFLQRFILCFHSFSLFHISSDVKFEFRLIVFTFFLV